MAAAVAVISQTGHRRLTTKSAPKVEVSVLPLVPTKAAPT
jgi:hypothetical protein